MLQAVLPVSPILTAQRREHGTNARPDSRGLGADSRPTIGSPIELPRAIDVSDRSARKEPGFALF